MMGSPTEPIESDFEEYIIWTEIAGNGDDTINIISKESLAIPSFSTIVDDRVEIIDEIEEQASLLDSCYLEWEEVEDWKTIIAYLVQNLTGNDICENNQSERSCNDWDLSLDEQYIYASCNDECEFKFVPECLDDQNIEWIPIYSYAPYNDIFNDYTEFLDTFLALYTKDATNNIDWISNYDEYAWMTIENLNENAKKLISDDNYWLMIDNFQHAEYVKYSWLNLTWDFAIEMRVEFPSTVPETTRYLFQLWDYKAYLDPYWVVFLKNSNMLYSDITKIYDWNFHTITAIKKSNDYFIKIDWEYLVDPATWNTETFNSTDPVWGELFIWSQNDSTLQLNDIIDYVKIYKN